MRGLGRLDALNDAWGTVFWSQTYGDWEEIPLPRRSVCDRRAHNPSLLLEHRRFASAQWVSFQAEQVRIIRALSPDRPITHNAMGSVWAIDYFELARDLDLIGRRFARVRPIDNYPGFDPAPHAIGMRHDLIRGLKGGPF